ncbi:hypothetical protein HDV05_003650 [Chytridiales sp. JEL 0842]|nr:hypothetical protein HDV05_003650 [Chytridiales sp. JEL 0842]
MTTFKDSLTPSLNQYNILKRHVLDSPPTSIKEANKEDLGLHNTITKSLKPRNLPPVKFAVLAMDLFDELVRRQQYASAVKYLPPVDTFTSDRNKARRALATIPASKLDMLVSTLVSEMELRFPEVVQESPLFGAKPTPFSIEKQQEQETLEMLSKLMQHHRESFLKITTPPCTRTTDSEEYPTLTSRATIEEEEDDDIPLGQLLIKTPEFPEEFNMPPPLLSVNDHLKSLSQSTNDGKPIIQQEDLRSEETANNDSEDYLEPTSEFFEERRDSGLDNPTYIPQKHSEDHLTTIDALQPYLLPQFRNLILAYRTHTSTLLSSSSAVSVSDFEFIECTKQVVIACMNLSNALESLAAEKQEWEGLRKDVEIKLNDIVESVKRRDGKETLQKFIGELTGEFAGLLEFALNKRKCQEQQSKSDILASFKAYIHSEASLVAYAADTFRACTHTLETCHKAASKDGLLKSLDDVRGTCVSLSEKIETLLPNIEKEELTTRLSKFSSTFSLASTEFARLHTEFSENGPSESFKEQVTKRFYQVVTGLRYVVMLVDKEEAVEA